MIKEKLLECSQPVMMEARRKSDQMPVRDIPKVRLRRNDRYTGLICLNSDQPKGMTCDDYEVRFCCKPGEKINFKITILKTLV